LQKAVDARIEPQVPGRDLRIYFLIGWGVFFVVWIATFMGVQKVDPLLIRAAQSLEFRPCIPTRAKMVPAGPEWLKSRWQLFRK
jgi:ABC-type nitrate/sulfonate/bicarbonate transport system permease component